MIYKPSSDRDELRQKADAMMAQLALSDMLVFRDCRSRVPRSQETDRGRSIGGTATWETITGLVLQNEDSARIRSGSRIRAGTSSTRSCTS